MNVSLKEVSESAGQFNKSAVQYHFGSREGLLAAIIREHLAAQDARTDEELEVLSAKDQITTREVMAAAIAGIVDLLKQGPRGYDVSRICCELGTNAEHGAPAIRNLLGRRSNDTSPFRLLLARANPAVPADLLEVRFRTAILMAFAVVSDRARELSSKPQRQLRLSHDEFANNLVVMLTAAVSAPSEG